MQCAKSDQTSRKIYRQMIYWNVMQAVLLRGTVIQLLFNQASGLGGEVAAKQTQGYTDSHSAVFPHAVSRVSFPWISGAEAAAAEKPAQTRGDANHVQSQASPEVH